MASGMTYTMTETTALSTAEYYGQRHHFRVLRTQLAQRLTVIFRRREGGGLRHCIPIIPT